MQKIIEILESVSDQKISNKDIVEEAVVLTREELDLEMLPTDFNEIKTSEDLLIEMFMFENYLAYRLSDAVGKVSYLVGVLKEDRLVWSEEIDNT